MDLNLLLKHHQLALMGVKPCPAMPEPVGTFDLVGHYARKIRRLRLELGAIHYPRWVEGDAPAGAIAL